MMKDHLTYQKELDPSSKEFDVNKALNELDVPGPSSVSTSIDAFEKELLENEENTELVQQLKLLDDAKLKGENGKRVGDRTRRRMNKQKAEQTNNAEIFKRTGIEYFSGVGFALAHDGFYECLRNWVKNRTRVTIKLQASSPKMQPNRCIQCVITAYDKHWNLLVRDCDEVYLPAKRLGHVQCYAGAMPENFKYVELKKGCNILSRYLRSTIIMGHSIVCIYDELIDSK